MMIMRWCNVQTNEHDLQTIRSNIARVTRATVGQILIIAVSNAQKESRANEYCTETFVPT